MRVIEYSPRYVGDTASDLLHTFIDGQGKPYDLSGVDVALMTLRLKPGGTGGQARDGAGSWYLVDASAGQAAYAWHEDDVNAAGIFQIQASFPLDGKPKHFSIEEIEFLDPL